MIRATICVSGLAAEKKTPGERERHYNPARLFKGVLGMVKISDLRAREIINVVDGRRLGLIKDIDIDLEQGRITSIILPGVSGKFLGFLGREEEIIVPWEKIVKIGADVILVEISSFTDPKHEFKINY